MRSGMVRGLKDGFARGPRSSLEVLSDAGVDVPDPQRGAAARMSGFSLLLPTYHADDPSTLSELSSVQFSEQQLPPSEVVLVRDGQVPAALDAAARPAQSRSRRFRSCEWTWNRMSDLVMPSMLGLSACEYDVVARMDSDDISLPTRFSVQIPLLDQGYDLVGSGLLEFGDDEDDIVGSRTPPTDEG